jgi:hypothetical protein
MKGREITLPSPYEQYTKLKTEFVTTNGKCHINTVQHVTYTCKNILLLLP